MVPPNAAISRTPLEDTNEYGPEAARYTVSISGARLWLSCCIWNSHSKSETARNPRLRPDGDGLGCAGEGCIDCSAGVKVLVVPTPPEIAAAYGVPPEQCRVPAGLENWDAFVARSAGCPDALIIDIGGTSADVSLIRGGEPQATADAEIDGFPIALPMLDIHTIGAGGGSLARTVVADLDGFARDLHAYCIAHPDG